MTFRSDSRGVSEVVGAVILFGFLIIALTSYQTVIVPQENAEVEYNSYLDARSDLTELQNNIIASGTRGVETGTTIQLGTPYPERSFAVNPPTATGQLNTGPPRTVSFENVSAVDTEARNTRLYWDGTERTFQNETTGLVFTPQYYEFEGQPIVVTGETISTIGDTEVSALRGQSLLSGDRVRLMFIDGDIDTEGVQASVSAVPRSTTSRTVTVTGNGGPPTLRFDPPPRVTPAMWVARYGEQLTTSNDRVERVTTENDQVVVQLNETRTYRLQLAQVSVSAQDHTVASPDPHYIVATAGDEQQVSSGQRATVTAEVRDRFNNPIGESAVEFEVTDGDARFLDGDEDPIEGARTMETDSDGQATTSLIVESAEEDVVVTARIVNESGTLTSTQFDIQVSQAPGQQEGSGAYLVSVSSGSAESPDDSNRGMSYILRNSDDDRDMTITQYRIERSTATMTRFDRRQNDPVIWRYPLTIDVNDNGIVDGYIDTNQLRIGETNSLDQQATIPPGEQAVFRHWESGNPGDDMTGGYIEVTIWFQMEGSNEEVSTTTTIFLF